MPSYTKFLKDIVTKKRKLERIVHVSTATKYSLTLSKLLLKKKDPRSFVIPCSIDDKYIGRALCDLGSSVSMMPKSIFLKLIGMGNSQPTTMILQLAGRSHVRPEGKIEDVIAKVDKFVFLIDFLILECETDENAPIILGCPSWPLPLNAS
ncbi:uncharacterized protein LOC120210932 [Hibiscus syriacus]|uniref:uncharacterized protein LOC120210932 n=1 Tax=Hibiscus syriacus TaxID=106335 RepID=UPI001923ACC3|nr:uncharacterized protein LOC120210932 [Hibiscus syriacus]